MSLSQLTSLRAFSRMDAACLTDDELIAEQMAFAAAKRLIEAGSAAVAAEIAARSSRELGYNGLAQSRGARTPEALIQQVTGISATDARVLVRVGTMLDETPEWLAPVAEAVTEGKLSVSAADAIRSGLGEPDRVTVDDLSQVAVRLVTEATGRTLEQTARAARDARAELDLDGVQEREEERRDRRFLSLTPLPDGMTRLSGLLDPESAAVISGAINAITSPRRGGPRFVDCRAGEFPQPDELDARTIPQLMVDALVDIVTVATHADARKVLGTKRVAVRVHVAGRDLASGKGFSHIEGQAAPASVATAERFACDAGILPIAFDTDGRVLNVGREQRTHTPRMRTALAARDGGCTIAGCERPPEMCEAHHTNEWLKHQGDTSVDDAVLLCRHHHMLVHNKKWKIERVGAKYWLNKSPGSSGGQREWVALQQRNPIASRLAC